MGMFNWFNGNNSADSAAIDPEFARYSLSLEHSDTATMMLDENQQIVLVNASLTNLFDSFAKPLAETAPQFAAQQPLQQSIKTLLQNFPAIQQLLNSAVQPFDSTLRMGDCSLQLHCIPVIDDKGSNQGTCIEFRDRTAELKKDSKLAAINLSQAVIEFDLDGHILDANDNFLNSVGYRLDEIVGKHHSMFVDDDYKTSDEYRNFWAKLNRGEFDSGEYRRIGKHDKEIWIQASYNPILDAEGKPTGVIKYATDITSEKKQAADFAGQISAIGKSQAVIEFNMDGIVLTANDNFLNALGYTLSEVQGQHHSIFVEPEERNSHEYKAFWDHLNRGEFSANEFKRIGKLGNHVWIQASYNPILDANGKPFKVVKYATDITGRKTALNEIKDILLKLSEGDLTCRIETELEGEFSELRDATNNFVSHLNSMINEISTASLTINGAAAEIAQGNSDLSNRTEQQASSLEETASSMEEITGTVRLNAENASQANGLASQAADVARNGGELIEQVVKTMSSINDSSRKISDIIGVIDGIAFQTNILALNAAVEAARAGEQGRGFAVVASEVRTLAQRSANAAKDIKELISDSVEKVESGNALVNQSGETMQEIVSSIQRVNDIMGEIAAASNQQASGVDEVGKAITQMDEMTQQNAALVEQAAAAAESMQSQAESLADRVQDFKVSEHQADATTNKALPNTNTHKPTSLESRSNQSKIPARSAIVATHEEDEWESF